MCLERHRTLTRGSLEGFCMYTHYGRVAPSLHRESTDSLILYTLIILVHTLLLLLQLLPVGLNT